MVIQKRPANERVLSILELVQKATKVGSIKKNYVWCDAKWRVRIFVSVSSCLMTYRSGNGLQTRICFSCCTVRLCPDSG